MEPAPPPLPVGGPDIVACLMTAGPAGLIDAAGVAAVDSRRDDGLPLPSPSPLPSDIDPSRGSLALKLCAGGRRRVGGGGGGAAFALVMDCSPYPSHSAVADFDGRSVLLLTELCDEDGESAELCACESG